MFVEGVLAAVGGGIRGCCILRLNIGLFYLPSFLKYAISALGFLICHSGSLPIKSFWHQSAQESL